MAHHITSLSINLQNLAFSIESWAIVLLYFKGVHLVDPSSN
jgi:hypothetical protein